MTHSEQETELSVERSDISFRDIAGGKVRIAVRISNLGSFPSRGTTIRLQSAPFGAFVPWRPLARLLVPELEPGQSHEVSTEAIRPKPAALGDFDRVPPHKLLTALANPEQPAPRRRAGLGRLMDLLPDKPTEPATQKKSGGAATLPADLWDLVGRGQPYWAGNINVFVGRRQVERHLSQALRIYPGRHNLAMFVVGGGARPDAYSFELAGPGSQWDTRLFESTANPWRALKRDSGAIKYGQWVQAQGALAIMLATTPPINCQGGNLEVRVTRRSCGTTAVVEFALDPCAQGPGCYTLKPGN